MPNWRLHIAVAEEIARNRDLNIENKDEYLFGAVLPDAPWIKEVWLRKPELKDKLHFVERTPEKLMGEPAYDEYLDEYREMLNTDMGKGVLTHLITDNIFNVAYNKIIESLQDGHYSLFTSEGKMIIPTAEQVTLLVLSDLRTYSYTLPDVSTINPDNVSGASELINVVPHEIEVATERVNDDTMVKDYLLPLVIRDKSFYDNLYADSVKTCNALLSDYN
jgi:hypothetical protein